MIVLDIQADRIRVADFADPRSDSKPRADFAASFPAEITPNAVDSLAAWLREQLKQAGIAKGEAVAFLSRGLVTIKTIRVPVVPDNELAGIVNFSVEGVLHQPGPAVVDYQPGPIHPAIEPNQSDEQEVTTAVVAASTLESIKTILQKAGLACRRIGVRPFATRAACPVPTEIHDQSFAVVYATSEILEVSIWTSHHLRNCRWMASPTAASTDRVGNEIRRTLAAFHAQADGDDVHAVLAFGQEAHAVLHPLRSTLAREVRTLEIDGVPTEAFSSIGAARLAAEKSDWPIDLLKVKRMSATTNHSRRTIVLAAAFAAILVLGAIFQLTSAFRSRDNRIRALQDQMVALDLQIAKDKPILDRHAVIDEWVESGDPILDELQEIAVLLPDTTDLFLTSLEYNSGQRDTPGTVKLDGLAKEQGTITNLQTKLVEDTKGRYEVIPRGVDPGADIGPFVWRWGIDLAVEPLETAGYTEQSAVRKDVLDTIKPPEGRARVDLSLARTSSSQSSSRSGRGDRRSSSDSSSSDSSKFFQEKVDNIRKLPPEEREEAIENEPRFLQKRLRKAIMEAEEAK